MGFWGLAGLIWYESAKLVALLILYSPNFTLYVYLAVCYRVGFFIHMATAVVHDREGFTELELCDDKPKGSGRVASIFTNF